MNQKTRKFAVQLAAFSLLGTNGAIAQVSIEEYRRIVNRTPAEKFQEALHILDDQNWYEQDRDISRLRDSNGRNVESKRTPLEGYIHDREWSALGTLLSHGLPAEQEKAYLLKYLHHRTEKVRVRSADFLIFQGYWGPAEAMQYAEQKGDLATWYRVLGGVVRKSPPRAVMPIARKTIDILLATEDLGHIDGSDVGVYGVGVLMHSNENSDHELVRRTVERFSNSPFLWAAVSRLPPAPKITALSRAVYADHSHPVSVRAAAALVFGKNDERIQKEIAGYITQHLSEFASEDVREKLIARVRAPDDQVTNEYYLRMKQTERLLTVAYELPPRVLEAHAQEWLKYSYGSYGQAMAAILARRIPSKFIAIVSEQNSINEGLYSALLYAARHAPEISSKASSLIPADKLELVETQMERLGGQPSMVQMLRLWD